MHKAHVAQRRRRTHWILVTAGHVTSPGSLSCLVCCSRYPRVTEVLPRAGLFKSTMVFPAPAAAPAGLAAMAALAGGSQSNLALFWPHGCCTQPALPRMSLPPLSGDTKALMPVLLLPCGAAGIFLPQGKGNRRRNKIQCKLGGEHNIKGKGPEDAEEPK